MTLPKRVFIHEVGPREGMQIEPGAIATLDKIRLVDQLSACGMRSIQVTSFVSPKWVPQMADAEQVAAGFARRPGTRYSCLFLNVRGLQRAMATGKFDLMGSLGICASDTFSRKNTNRDVEQTFSAMPERIAAFRDAGLPVTLIMVSATFGCNYEGTVEQDHVIGLLDRTMNLAGHHGCTIREFNLMDTMGWATPNSVRSLVGRVRDRWPEMRITLHLHDTRGMGLANALAALDMGVVDFDASVGGLGGCPFAGFKGAAGNIVTEDLVHMCEEMGIQTGVDLDPLLDAAREAERIVGHPLPGKVMHGGSLSSYRKAQAAGA